jgi:glucose-6-phosphate-specific signal transduction histidine kinase
VSGDGVGIEPGRGRGMGLIGIEERVRELHGTFEVGPRKPAGTELRAIVPVTVSPVTLSPVTLSTEEGQRARALG